MTDTLKDPKAWMRHLLIESQNFTILRELAACPSLEWKKLGIGYQAPLPADWLNFEESQGAWKVGHILTMAKGKDLISMEPMKDGTVMIYINDIFSHEFGKALDALNVESNDRGR